MSKLPWFRFYTEALDDPKVQRLSPPLFKTWVNLLCLAGANGGTLPSVDDIAFRLRLSVHEAQCQLDELILVGLIDIAPNSDRAPHNWEKRQFVSDRSTERVRKFRKTKRNTACNGDETLHETAPEQSRAESDTDSELAAPLPPKGETKQQGFKNGFAGGSFSQAKREEVRELTRKRAEGFGLPVDEILAEAKQASPKNLDAYFQAICRRRLASKLPGIADEALRKAFGPDPRAMAAVCTALMEAP